MKIILTIPSRPPYRIYIYIYIHGKDDPCTTMFFYRNKHIMVDLGTGNNNKINWALTDKQEMINIIEVRVK